jgi:hypothetical protein
MTLKQQGPSWKANSSTLSQEIVIQIHSVAFTIIEIRTNFTAKHNILMPHNNVLHVSVHQNHHRAPLLRKFKNTSTFATCNFFFSENSIMYNYLLK